MGQGGEHPDVAEAADAAMPAADAPTLVGTNVRASVIRTTIQVRKKIMKIYIRLLQFEPPARFASSHS
jgi:hypothetical protein